MLVWAIPAAVILVGLAAAAAAAVGVGEEMRRIGHAADRWAELRASWWPLRREARDLSARLARWRRR